jgi:hypothetical protein
MYEETAATPPDDNSTEDALRKLLDDALKAANGHREETEKALKAITDAAGTLGKTLEKDAQQKLDQLKAAGKDPIGTLKKALPTPDNPLPTPDHPFPKL